ncbi:MAG: hypothetical protein V4591_10700 [Bdellovibrionota bacterium]
MEIKTSPPPSPKQIPRQPIAQSDSEALTPREGVMAPLFVKRVFIATDIFIQTKPNLIDQNWNHVDITGPVQPIPYFHYSGMGGTQAANTPDNQD